MKNKVQRARKRLLFLARTTILCWVLGISFLAAHATEPHQQETGAHARTALALLAKIAAAGASGQFGLAEQFFAQGKEAGLSPLQKGEVHGNRAHIAKRFSQEHGSGDRSRSYGWASFVAEGRASGCGSSWEGALWRANLSTECGV
jgi:hypothetical protein